jgi:hypothetical protein
MQRDHDSTPNELQRALLEYDAHPLETQLIEWTAENWPMAARGMTYARKEAAETVSGVQGLRSEEPKLALEIAARVAIAERVLMCRAVAAVLPGWLEETYGLTPKK